MNVLIYLLVWYFIGFLCVLYSAKTTKMPIAYLWKKERRMIAIVSLCGPLLLFFIALDMYFEKKYGK